MSIKSVSSTNFNLPTPNSQPPAAPPPPTPSSGGLVLNLAGKRVAVISSFSSSSDPFQILDKLDQQISQFEKDTQSIPISYTPLSSSPPLAAPLPKEAAETDEVLRKVTAHVSNFSILYVLHWAIGQSANTEAIFEMTRRSVGESNANLKEMIFTHYNLSWFWRVVVHLVFFFCTFRGFFPKTIEEISKRLLQELRFCTTHALQGEGQKAELVPRLISESAAFLRTIRQAFEDYASNAPFPTPNPTLEDRINSAIEHLYNKSLYTLCVDASKTLIHQIIPTIEYKPGATWMNWTMNKIVRWFLRFNLPGIMEQALQKSNEAMSPHALPFVKAILETTKERLADFQKNMKIFTPHPGDFPGTENLPELVEQFLVLLNYGPSPTQSEIRQKMNQPPDKLLTAKFQAPLVQGLKLLFHYLARPENREPLFTNLLNLLDLPFTTAQHVTREEVQDLNEQLTNLGGEVFREILEETAEERIFAEPPSPDKTKQFTKEQFDMRKERALSTLKEMQTEGEDLCQKLNNSHSHLSAILSDLAKFKNQLKDFSFKEKAAQKQLDALSNAEKQAILLPLTPLYTEACNLMTPIGELQQKVKSLHLNTQERERAQKTLKTLHQFKTIRENLAAATSELLDFAKGASSSEREPIIQKLQNCLDQIGEILSSSLIQDPSFLQALQTTQEEYRQFILLQKVDQYLRAYFSENKRRRIPSLITNLLSHFPPSDQTALQPLIFSLQTPANVATKNRVTQQMQEIQRRIIDHLNTADQILGKTWPQLVFTAETRLMQAEREIETLDREMKELGLQIKNGIENMQRAAQEAAKEQQIYISKRQLVTGGITGAAMTASYLAGPVGGLIIGGLAYVLKSLGEKGAYIDSDTGDKQLPSWGDVGSSLILPTVATVAALAAPAAAPYVPRLAGAVAKMATTAAPLAPFVPVATAGVIASTIPSKTIEGATQKLQNPVMELFLKARAFLTNSYIYAGLQKVVLNRIHHFS